MLESSLISHLHSIRSACAVRGVKRLEVFGSAARADFNPLSSDFDFLVEFASDDWHGAADRWFGLIEDLEALLGRKVELTSLKTAHNPYFLEKISPDRVEIYVS